MNIKMLTGFKTDKFGILQNHKVYDLPDSDAEGLLRNGRAVLTEAPAKLSQNEIINKGAIEGIKKLKSRKKKKETLMNTNEKSEAAIKVKKESLKDIDAEIGKLEAQKDSVKGKNKK